MALVYEPEMVPSRENRIPERNGWSGELLVEMLGISGQKEKEELGFFTSSEKAYTRRSGGVGKLTSSERASIVESAPCGANQEIGKPGVSYSLLPHDTATENISTIHQRSHSESETVWSAPVPCDAAVSSSKKGFVFHPLKGTIDKSLFSLVRNTCSTCLSQIQGTNTAPSHFSEDI